MQRGGRCRRSGRGRRPFIDLDYGEAACHLEHLERCQCCHWACAGSFKMHHPDYHLSGGRGQGRLRRCGGVRTLNSGAYCGPLNVENVSKSRNVRCWVTPRSGTRRRSIRFTGVVSLSVTVCVQGPYTGGYLTVIKAAQDYRLPLKLKHSTGEARAASNHIGYCNLKPCSGPSCGTTHRLH